MDGNNKINFLFFVAVILFIGLIGLYLSLDNSQLISSSTEVIDLTSWN